MRTDSSLLDPGARRTGFQPKLRAISAALLLAILLGPRVDSAFAQNPSVNINFQPANISAPGYVPDSGQTYADRGNGFSYGWNVSHTDRARYFPPTFPGMNPAYWTLIQMLPDSSTTWEIGLPNGTYQVTIVAGGPINVAERQRIKAEDVMVVDRMPGDYSPWVDGTAWVTVSDGRLTVSNAQGATRNHPVLLEIVGR